MAWTQAAISRFQSTVQEPRRPAATIAHRIRGTFEPVFDRNDLADDGLPLGEDVMFNGEDDACGTPPTPVAVAAYVPDGAAFDVARIMLSIANMFCLNAYLESCQSYDRRR